MQEEQIRDLILVDLNGHYEGDATGETFNNQGKTDILIRADGKNVFIAECKFWEGQKALHTAIDQILGYLTWRDTKAALLLFSKKVGFTDVLAKIATAVPEHLNFKQELRKVSDTHVRYLFRQKFEGVVEQGRLEGAGISKTIFYRWLQWGATAKSGKFREFCQSLKEMPSHDGSRYPPGIACRVVETAKSGRFLEFLESLKRPERSSMSRTSSSSNGPRPERVSTGMRHHADTGAPSDRSDLKPSWLTASGQTAKLLHFRGRRRGFNRNRRSFHRRGDRRAAGSNCAHS